VIHPHLPVRIPCYDLVLIADLAVVGPILAVLVSCFGRYQLCWLDGQCVQGARTYSPQPADLRLLPIPTSWGRVAALNLNWGTVYGISSRLPSCDPLSVPL